MFSKIGFLAADLLNDGVTETVPCVPVVFPNPVSSCDSERSIHLCHDTCDQDQREVMNDDCE